MQLGGSVGDSANILRDHDDHDQADKDELPVQHEPTSNITICSTGFAQIPLSNATRTSSSSSSIQMRQLLLSCAELISQSDFFSAQSLISVLSANSSPYGDSTERLALQFVRALSLLLNRQYASSSFRSRSWEMMNSNNDNINGYVNPPPSPPLGFTTTSSSFNNLMMSSGSKTHRAEEEEEEEEEALQCCYLSINQITPFIRFSHLTANQAILEAIDVAENAIHIIDFNTMHGVQWPPLMQALAERSNNNSSTSPTMLRITGTGHDLNILQRTGDRLLKFAESLGLRFQFHPLLIPNNDPISLTHYLNPSSITLLPREALAVNCVLHLHTLLKDDSRDLSLVLHKIKALNPKVVTIAEREANHNHPLFLERFAEALDYFTSIFDSLEATVPPNSRERMAVEQIWFGREIVDIVAAEGKDRRARHERYESWEMMTRGSGFTKVPLSPFALSQAKLLLRLHYPCEGYQLHIINNTFFLGWKNRPLFSVSSWH